MRTPKRARREAFDLPAADKFLTALRTGNFERTAGKYARLSRRTVRQWLEAGSKEEHGLLRDFYEQYQAAKASAEVMAVAHLFGDTKGKYRAAETFLRLRYGDNWRVKRVEERKYDDAQKAAAKQEKAVAAAAAAEPFEEGFVEEVAAVLRRVSEGVPSTGY